ncbi:MAG TPA: squalene--hopene cyclase [Candidatus Nitrosocosmicus sp.]|nr:squalene--hopene cyclase [Candidatus Nitrosocosmicus sp.]
MSASWLEPTDSRADAREAEITAQHRAALAEAAGAAALRAGEAVLALQKPDGYWCGDLLADTTLESDYVLLQLWLYPPEAGVWRPPTWGRIEKTRRAILARQLPDGGFSIYPDGPAELNATVKAYAALKLAGLSAESEPLARARECILRLGGIQETNSYVRINLSLFGLYPRRHVPTIPPELVLLPGGLIYEMSSWTRAIVVPLSIVQSRAGRRPVPHGFDLDELAAPGKSFRLPRRDRLSAVFSQLDIALKVWEKGAPEMIRKSALREAEKWMLDRTRHSDGLGAIYPSMMYFIMALECLGYPRDHPDLVEALRVFERLRTETEDGVYFQPCFSPVWDTAIAMFALGEAGIPAADAQRRAADWLIEREVRRRGDWSVKRPDLEPSGWAFEFSNEHYPDIDDTAMVLMALEHARASDPDAQARCERRAGHWLAQMQSSDGGWAAFDVDNNWALLNRVPFADHNAMLDPTCPDITGRVLEALCRRGLKLSDLPVDRGVAYLLQTQEADGSWYGRWGVNYLYGSFLALRGLRASRDRSASRAIWKSGRWIASVQNADGGWGESCASYGEGRFVPAPSTPSQTAWALLGLIAAGQAESESLIRGARHLIDTQRADGTWDETLATGTGFPGVFYLRYTLYRNYFPLLALVKVRAALEGATRTLRFVREGGSLGV